MSASYDGSVLMRSENGGYVYLSVNSGSTWSQVASLGAISNYKVGLASSYDGTKLVVVKDNRLYTSVDSGVNWSEYTALGTGWVGAVAISSDGTKILAIRGSQLYLGQFSS